VLEVPEITYSCSTFASLIVLPTPQTSWPDFQWRRQEGFVVRSKKRFTKVRQNGSHITFRVNGGTTIYAFQDTRDLGERHLRMIANDFGLTLERLKELL
jgi:predicted RNA binding protein YcfA (HicA-like mRNA interferase family)